MLTHYLVKHALLSASKTLEHQGDVAEKRRLSADHRAGQIGLINELIHNTRKSPLRSTAHGALQGLAAFGLGGALPSLVFKDPRWLIGGAVGGALAGGYVGYKTPEWSANTLRSYAKGRQDPVFMDSDSNLSHKALSSQQRALIQKVLRGIPHHG